MAQATPNDEGQPEPKNLPRSIGNELGRSGLVHMDGTLYEEFLPNLQGQKGVKKFREMSENSAILSATIFAIESLLRSVEWFVEPASDEEADTEAAEFLESCREDMSHTWEDFISEVLSMMVYGWSFFEIVYKQRRGPEFRSPRRKSKFDDGRIGWRKFAPRPQDTLDKWDLDTAGGLNGMWQELPITSSHELDTKERNVFIPIEKALLFRTTSRKNSPEGKSLLRGGYRAYYFAKRLEEVEALGAERDLAGLPIAYVPAEILATDRTSEAEATYNTIKDIVQKTKRDEQEGIIFPLEYDDNGNLLYKFELLSSPSRRQFNIGEIIQRYNQHMAMSLLADFILLGHENVGSFALSSDKTELFSVAMGAFLDSIETTLNRYAVPRLFDLNSFEVEDLPQFRHGDIESPNLNEVASYISSLVPHGFFSEDYELESHLRHIADLPELSPEEYEAAIEAKEQKAQEQFQQQMQLKQFGPQNPGGKSKEGDDDEGEGDDDEGGSKGNGKKKPPLKPKE